MSDYAKDGGSAFPQLDRLIGHENRDNSHSFEAESFGGMTLRDYFAAKFMAVFVKQLWERGPEGSHADAESRLSAFAYRIADAMLAERAK